MKAVMMKIYYYDGHYPDSEFTIEELDEQLAALKKESDAMTEWEKID